MAERIQRKRQKGWRTPANTVYAGRGSVFGNPFPVTAHQSRSVSIERFRKMVTGQGEEGRIMHIRRDRILANLHRIQKADYVSCWCTLDQQCHVDVLLELAKKVES